MFTCWQVTLCDISWQVTLLRSQMGLYEELYRPLTFFTFLVVTQEKHRSELESLKLTHASSLAGQAADCQMYKLQIDNDRINIEQLKKALDAYQQREVRCVETSAK